MSATREPTPTEQAYAVCASDVETRPIEWLWPGYIPLGKITVYDGHPGLAKSMSMLDVSARITTGRPMPDGTTGTEGAVVYLNFEDDLHDTVVPRFLAAGGDPSKLFLCEAIRTADGFRPLEVPDHVRLLEDLVIEKRAVFVVVDPLMATLGPDVKSGIDHHVRRALAPLRAMAERTRAAVVVVRHLNKAASISDPILRGGGSIGIIGAARAGLMVVRDPEDPSRRVLAISKTNLGPDDRPSLAYRVVSDLETGVGVIDWLGTDGRSAGELLQAANAKRNAEPDPDSAVGEAVAILREFLAEGEQRATEAKRYCAEAGVSQRTLDRAKKVLRVKARPLLNGGVKHWWWTLPDTGCPEGKDAKCP